MQYGAIIYRSLSVSMHEQWPTEMKNECKIKSYIQHTHV